MAAKSREAFVRALGAFTQAADAPLVRAADDTGDLLRRGLTVTGFNLLETFITSRLEEIAGYLNGGQANFTDLPELLQRRAIRNTLEIGATRMKRMGKAASTEDLRGFARTVGGSIAAVDRSLSLSAFTWLWQGSNLAAPDYAAILRAFHVGEPWTQIDAIALRLGFSNSGLEQGLIDLARERHKCAHEALYGVTSIWLRTVPPRVLALGIGFDSLVSVAATRLRAGESKFIADDKAMSGVDVGLRYVRERVSGAAEIAEGATRASHLGADPDALFAAAAARCKAKEVVVRQTRAGGIVDWAIPSVN
jgi:hypothetical protein